MLARTALMPNLSPTERSLVMNTGRHCAPVVATFEWDESGAHQVADLEGWFVTNKRGVVRFLARNATDWVEVAHASFVTAVKEKTNGRA